MNRRNPHRADATPEPHGFPYRAGVAPLSEHQLQRQVAAFLDRALPADAWWTSIDSAGRGPVQGAKMKARGVKKGLPDILLLHRDMTLWIELKSPRGRVSTEQNGFFVRARAAGHIYGVCKTLDDVAATLNFLGIPLRCKVSA